MSGAIVPPTIASVAKSDRVRLLESLQACLTELGVSADYPSLDLYWREHGRHPYWIRVAGSDAGFALVRRMENGVMEIAEFFVAPPWRRKGVGLASARALFAMHPGTWQIASFPRSAASEAFWAKAVPAGARRLQDGERSVFSFSVHRAV
jgi:predicted acetyltransferase